MTSPLVGQVVAPGDTLLKLPREGVIKIGGGVLRVGHELHSSHGGTLQETKGKLFLAPSSKRYVPVAGDLVIGYITGAFAEDFKVDIRASVNAVLPVLAFDGATKRNRPRLSPGDIVFARVAETSRDMEPELTCIDSAPSGKATTLGPLKSGYVMETNTTHARKLLGHPLAPELVALGETLAFEIAVGANGRVLVHSQAPRVTAVVVQALKACERLPPDASRARVAELLADSERMAVD